VLQSHYLGEGLWDQRTTRVVSRIDEHVQFFRLPGPHALLLLGPLPHALCKHGPYSCQIPGRFWSDAECQSAVQGTACHDEVTWAMDYGINEHPEWYPSLTNQSSFGEFQARLFQGQPAAIESSACPEPCCHDTLPGELCHEDAEWAMLYGINVPEVSHWYPPSLTNQSSLAEFQAWMHLCHADRCPEPCVATEILASPFDASLDCA